MKWLPFQKGSDPAMVTSQNMAEDTVTFISDWLRAERTPISNEWLSRAGTMIYSGFCDDLISQ